MLIVGRISIVIDIHKTNKNPLFSLWSFQKKHEKIWVEKNSIKSDSKGSVLKKVVLMMILIGVNSNSDNDQSSK